MAEGSGSATSSGSPCAEGEIFATLGCGAEHAELPIAPISDGCYQPCTLGDETCPEGTRCRRTDVYPSGGGDACGAEAWLCIGGDGPYDLASLDEHCEDDETLTGQHVLGAIGEEYGARFEYLDERPDTSLTVAFKYTEGVHNGALICYPAEGDAPPRLEVRAEVEVTTADGAFDEARLNRGWLSLESGEDSIGFRVRFNLNGLTGTYEGRLTDVGAPGVHFTGILMGSDTWGTATEEGTTLDGELELLDVGSWAPG